MTKRKPAKLTENERLHILLSIAERRIQTLLKIPDKLTADYRKLESENSRLRSLDSLKTVALADSIHTCSQGCKKSGCNRGLRDTIDDLKAENERLVEQYNSIIDQQLSVIADLKAEVERLHERIAHGDRHTNTLCNLKAEIQEENERLKAELDRLRASSFVTAVPVEQYERLIKAGDAMCRVMISHIGANGVTEDWHAAKQPPTDQTK